MDKEVKRVNSFINKYNQTFDDLPKPKKDIYKKNKIKGELMHKDTVVAHIIDDELLFVERKLAPSYFKLGGDLRYWLENRCIDMHRTNSRLIRRMLSIRTTNEIEVVLSVHAHTLTDNYWIRLYNEPSVKYKDIQYSKDLLFDTALYGSTDKIDNIYDYLYTSLIKDLKIEIKPQEITNNDYILKTPDQWFVEGVEEYKKKYSDNSKKIQNWLTLKKTYNTPELTLGGSFEKGWKLIEGEWYLVKAGDDLNNSAELIGSYIGQQLGFNVVKYEKYNDHCVCCKNFTENLKYDFEPMFDFLGETDDIEKSAEYIEEVNENFLEDFMDMVFLDALILNPDRHTNNYGFLRDSDTGEFIGLAPNFDNNLALFATKQKVTNLDVGNKGQLDMFYIPVLQEYRYKVPKLTYEQLHDIVEKAYSKFKPEQYDVKFTTDFIWNKYEHIKSRLEE